MTVMLLIVVSVIFAMGAIGFAQYYEEKKDKASKGAMLFFSLLSILCAFFAGVNTH
ncbi:MAG: hypothetical protein PHR16_16665 [Methylovulum sp.]|nr:hypothetical protein [Methylovulum sp.]